jgi:licheninase
VFSDDFEGTSVDTAKWGLYSGAGNAGNGERSPQQITVANGAVTLACTTGGTCAGMMTNHAQKYGTWAARAKMSNATDSVHPICLLWPVDDVWPDHGEVNYLEADPKSQRNEGWLHFGPNDDRTHAEIPVDLSQWHVYSVTWTPSSMTYYIDGRQWFQDNDPTHLPPVPMTATIQLDWSGGRIAPGATMTVDWLRIWAP